jgi:hypothetical protein
MKIYIVTSGEYSDYGIVGCFDKKETAQAYIDAVKKDMWSHYAIEEYELNNTFSKQPKWFIRMTKAGDTTEIESLGIVGLDHESQMGFDYFDNLIAYMGADTEAGAVKILNERRAFLITNNRWGREKR